METMMGDISDMEQDETPVVTSIVRDGHGPISLQVEGAGSALQQRQLRDFNRDSEGQREWGINATIDTLLKVHRTVTQSIQYREGLRTVQGLVREFCHMAACAAEVLRTRTDFTPELYPNFVADEQWRKDYNVANFPRTPALRGSVSLEATAVMGEVMTMNDATRGFMQDLVDNVAAEAAADVKD